MKRIFILILLVILIISNFSFALALPEAKLIMEEIITMPPKPSMNHGILPKQFKILEENLPLDNPLIFIPDLKLQGIIREILSMKKYHPIEFKHLLMLGGTLDLSEQNIDNLGGLEYAKNLTGIIADGNINIQIPENLNIKYLSLNDCSLNQIPDSIYSINGLEYLSLNNNNIAELKPEIFTDSIKYLSISDNPITTLPEEILNAANIILLNLGNCSITTMPDISSLTFLKSLDISNNRLIEFPDFLNTYELEELNISGCDFDINKFTPPSTIKYLDVSNNKCMYGLSDAIINLENLIYLNVSNSGLIALPLTTKWHYSIDYLDISNNKIEILPYAFHSVDIFVANRNLFTKMPILTGHYIDFRGNYLKEIPKFSGELIMLQYNMIDNIDDQLIMPSMLSVKVKDGVINLKFSATSLKQDNVSLLGYKIVKNKNVLDVVPKTTTSWQGENVLPGEIHYIIIEAINTITDDELGKFFMYTKKSGIASLPATPAPAPTMEPTPTAEPTAEPVKKVPVPWASFIWFFLPALIVIAIGIGLIIFRRIKNGSK